MSIVDDGKRLRSVDTAIVISPHTCWGSAVSFMIAQTLSSSDLLKFSGTGFCSGVSDGALSKAIAFPLR